MPLNSKNRILLFGAIVVFFGLIVFLCSVYIQRRQLLNAVAEIKSRPVYGAELVTNFGVVDIQFDKNVTKTRENFVNLVRNHFYDGLRFHRVVPGFAIQVGDPQTRDLGLISKWGTMGPGYSGDREIGEGNKIVRGSVIIASEGENDSGSQIMILTKDAPWLEGKNTILGNVISGMDVVDAISNVEVGKTEIPTQEIKLLEVKLK